MNWNLSRLVRRFLLLLCLVWFRVFCLFVFCPLFVFWWRFRDDLLDCTQVLYQFTLEATQSADGHICTN